VLGMRNSVREYRITLCLGLWGTAEVKPPTVTDTRGRCFVRISRFSNGKTRLCDSDVGDDNQYSTGFFLWVRVFLVFPTLFL
jgi:hypothetical protein